jgi:hypothetical protein
MDCSLYYVNRNLGSPKYSWDFEHYRYSDKKDLPVRYSHVTFCRELLACEYQNMLDYIYQEVETMLDFSENILMFMPGSLGGPLSIPETFDTVRFGKLVASLNLFRGMSYDINPENLAITFTFPYDYAQSMQTAPNPAAISTYILLACTRLRSCDSAEDVVNTLLTPDFFLRGSFGVFEDKETDLLMTAFYVQYKKDRRDIFDTSRAYSGGPGGYMRMYLTENYIEYKHFVKKYHGKVSGFISRHSADIYEPVRVYTEYLLDKTKEEGKGEWDDD